MDKDYFWYLVTAELRVQVEDKVKTIKKTALVHATGLSEIDTVANKVFEIFTTFPNTIRVVSVKEVSDLKVFSADFDNLDQLSESEEDGQTLLYNEEDSQNAVYLIQVAFFTLDEKSGKMKKSGKTIYAKNAETQAEALKFVKEHLKDAVVDWKDVSCKLSNIEAVLEYNTNVED